MNKEEYRELLESIASAATSSAVCDYEETEEQAAYWEKETQRLIDVAMAAFSIDLFVEIANKE